VGDACTLPADVIATVNGFSIPVSAVEATVMRDPGVVNPIIDKLVNDCLIAQEATTQHLSATSNEIDGRKEELKALNHVSNLTNLLSRHHETMADLDHDITMWIDTMKLLTPSATAPVIMQIRYVLVRVSAADQAAPPPPYSRHTDAQALAIAHGLLAKLANGESFDEIAKVFSEDTAAQQEGGDLAFAYDNGTLDPSIVTTATGLKAPGDTCPAPIKTSLDIT
jgi:foldase protein PrsA